MVFEIFQETKGDPVGDKGQGDGLIVLYWNGLRPSGKSVYKSWCPQTDNPMNNPQTEVKVRQYPNALS